MAATPDLTEPGQPSNPSADGEVDFGMPAPAPPHDPYATLGRDALRAALEHREADLAGARADLHAALDDRARIGLDLGTCREALEHREADLAGARRELHALLDRHAHLALDRDGLVAAIADREADLALARRETAAAVEHAADRDARVNALEAEVRMLQDAAPAERSADATPTDTRVPAQPTPVKPASRWDDVVFYVRYMFNLHNG